MTWSSGGARGARQAAAAQSIEVDVLVTVFDTEHAAVSMQLVAKLRASGLRVTVYPEAGKLAKQFKYADRLGASSWS